MRPKRTLVTTALILALSACSAANPAPHVNEPPPTPTPEDADEPHPWAAEIERAYRAAESDFVRAILADGIIERHEAREAMYRFVECMAEQGKPVEFIEWEDSFSFWTDDPNDEWGMDFPDSPGRVVYDYCQAQWLGNSWEALTIWMLWEDIQRNPTNIDVNSMDDAIAECLVRNGLAPEGFTGQHYREVYNQHSVWVTGCPGCDFVDAGGTWDEWFEIQRQQEPRVTLQDGSELWFGDDIFRTCQWNPLHDLLG
ncbi:MAG: hypothetical protein FWD83_07950 [Promicromonosporaceae bacterium]|nr:hypothetical protein [Promicromonosporaceae bacterium]